MTVDEAISTLSQSDPIIKLLQQVKLGRMRPTDPGLLAVTESWLNTYRKLLESAADLDQTSLLRLDPSPRVDVLVDSGVLKADHPAAVALCEAFQRSLKNARLRAAPTREAPTFGA
ncbi:MAG: hypothetical protein ACREIS_06160 [Nitrospiraceae bacterium]